VEDGAEEEEGPDGLDEEAVLEADEDEDEPEDDEDEEGGEAEIGDFEAED
jgi:hypothetical protein